MRYPYRQDNSSRRLLYRLPAPKPLTFHLHCFSNPQSSADYPLQVKLGTSRAIMMTTLNLKPFFFYVGVKCHAPHGLTKMTIQPQ